MNAIDSRFFDPTGLTESIRRYFEKQGYDKFEKAKVYLWLLRKWSTETLDDLPTDFVENIGKIFEEVNKLFDDMLNT